GFTAKLRGVAGYDDAVNRNSAAYRYGGYAGQVVNIGLMVANPASGLGALGFFSRSVSGGFPAGLTAVHARQMGGGGRAAGDALAEGNYAGAVVAVAGAGLSGLRMAGGYNPCAWQSVTAAWGQRTMHVVGAGTDAAQGLGRIMDGDIIGGLLD